MVQLYSYSKILQRIHCARQDMCNCTCTNFGNIFRNSPDETRIKKKWNMAESEFLKYSCSYYIWFQISCHQLWMRSSSHFGQFSESINKAYYSNGKQHIECQKLLGEKQEKKKEYNITSLYKSVACWCFDYYVQILSFHFKKRLEEMKSHWEGQSKWHGDINISQVYKK